jgi:D-glycero-alpha-D-manno-heptose-7-phosphate kinase
MSFVGGGSDLPSYYKKFGGAVLSTSINKYMYVTVNRKFDDGILLHYSKTEDVKMVSEIKHPLVRESLLMLGINKNIEITSMADIPSKGSGLGSSSSYTVGLLNALHAYKNNYISKYDLAMEASKVEIELCEEPIGKQDQYAASFGGLNLIRFHQDGNVSVEPLLCKPDTIKEFQESILMFYTGCTRSASSILKEQEANLSTNRSIIKTMGEMVKLSYEMKRMLEQNDLCQVGPLLDKNWKLKCQITSSITNHTINEIYQEGIKAGASGGKLLGAGSSGFVIFFAEKEKHSKIRKRLHKLREVPVSFDNTGSQIVLYQPTGNN